MPSKRDPFDVEVGRRIRQARRAAGFTQRELAARIGLDENTYGSYERGWTPLPIAVLSKLRGLLDRPADYFLAYPPPAGQADDEQLLLQFYRALPEPTKESLLQVARSLAGASRARK